MAEEGRKTRDMTRYFPETLRGQEGVALIISLVILVLITGLGIGAIMYARMDASVSGYYRAQREAEVAADSALELAMAMIFSDDPLLQLPINIDGSWTGSGDIVYQDTNLDVTLSVAYKPENTINYNATETFADEVVRYGQDYNYAGALKALGKQPVYTVTLIDNKTGLKAEADIISQLGFRTPAAIFVRGGANSTIDMMKNPYATEEKIEVTSGEGAPALATVLDATDVFIQHALTTYVHSTSGNNMYQDQRNNPADEDDGHTFFIDAANYLYPDVATDGEIAAAIAAGDFNDARDWQHCLLGVGDPTEDLDGYATLAEAQEEAFNFDQNDPDVVEYGYTMPGGGTLEELVGADFPDFRDLADQVLSGDETVTLADGSSVDQGKNLSGMTFGTGGNPQIVFFESNMNDDGSYIGGQRELTLVTAGGAVQGFGILVVNGDVNIQGSINWTGLMLIRGDLIFRPWQGGTAGTRSDDTLRSEWNGFIMIGGDMELWTWYGGTIILGYTTQDVATIKGIISSAIPHKVLNWRRLYN
jgi:hypothetical protein